MKRFASVVAAAAVVAAALVVGAPAASAQAGPPGVTLGCTHFAENALRQISSGPALEAFVRGFEQGGIGPCFAPHEGGR